MNADKECTKCQFSNDTCLECESEKVCNKCKDGHSLREERVNGKIETTCLACPTEDGCLTCSDNVCQSC